VCHISSSLISIKSHDMKNVHEKRIMKSGMTLQILEVFFFIKEIFNIEVLDLCL